MTDQTTEAVPGPIWKQIESELSLEVSEGRYPPGSKLPTEAELSKRFGVNRHTVRRAIAAMQTSGLLYARRGSGVYVSARPLSYPLGRRVRFHESLTAAGQTASKEILRIETIGSGAREAMALNLASGTNVIVWEGLGLADDVPVSLFQSWFPAALGPAFVETLRATRSVTAALTEAGIPDYTRASTEISAELATGLRARHLRLRDGAPVLRTVAINVDSAKNPVEYGRTWFAGDRLKLTV